MHPDSNGACIFTASPTHPSQTLILCQVLRSMDRGKGILSKDVRLQIKEMGHTPTKGFQR